MGLSLSWVDGGIPVDAYYGRFECRVCWMHSRSSFMHSKSSGPPLFKGPVDANAGISVVPACQHPRGFRNQSVGAAPSLTHEGSVRVVSDTPKSSGQ